MIKRELVLNLFDTTSIQRWNDKLRPINLVELDYQGHRMNLHMSLENSRKSTTPLIGRA